MNTCLHCGGPVERKGSTGPQPRYCSDACRSKASYQRSKADGRLERQRARRRQERQPTRHDKVCSVCATPFVAKRKDKRYCSKQCAAKTWTNACAKAGCDKPRRAQGLCIAHYNQAKPDRHRHTNTCEACGTQYQTTRYNGRFCSLLCRDYTLYGPRLCKLPAPKPRRIKPPKPARVTLVRDCGWCGGTFSTMIASQVTCSVGCKVRAKRARRRGREHGATGCYTWAEVIGLFLRFDRCCAYCRQPIDGQPEPDHVVPLSRGGSNSIINILPSCSLCNADKRDLLLHEWAEDRQRRVAPPRATTWASGDPRYIHLTSATLTAAA